MVIIWLRNPNGTWNADGPLNAVARRADAGGL